MTALLDRLDRVATAAVSDVGTGELVGWVLIAVGGFIAVVCAAGVVSLYFWGDLLTVGDLW